MYVPDATYITSGSYIVWDTEFGPGPDHWEKSKLDNDSTIQFLKSFKGENFEAAVYRKIK